VLIEVFGASAVEQMIPVGEERLEAGGETLEAGDERLEVGDQTSDPNAVITPAAESRISTLRVQSPISNYRVRGYAALPSLDHGNRTKIIVFVNGRPVQDAKLSYAVVQAYHTLLMTGRYPIAVIMLQAPTEDVDVNVHPAKAEVRFRDADVAFSAIMRAVRKALLAHLPVPEPPSVFVDWRGEIGDSGLETGTVAALGASSDHTTDLRQATGQQTQLSGAESWERVGIARNVAPASSGPVIGDLQSTLTNSPATRAPQLPALNASCSKR
jgi:hypothetical protein